MQPAKLLRCSLLAAALLLGALLPMRAYDYIRHNGQPITWWPGSVTIQVRMDTGRVLQDGSNFATSAQAAMDAWNAQLGKVALTAQFKPAGAGSDSDGVNDMFFASDIFGEAFGANVLAVTTTFYYTQQRTDGTYPRAEADVIFNTAWTWDSYRGTLQSPEDFRRVAIHELGHLLGLDHPDQATPVQRVDAIMNSRASNRDALAQDDIDGGQSLYGSRGSISRPANDSFASAVTLSSGSIQTTGTSLWATKEHGEPDHAPGERGGASVWWKWVAPSNGSLVVDTNGSDYDTLLAAYTGGSVSGLTQLAANDDIEPPTSTPNPNRNRRSSVTINVTSGTTYSIAVDGWDGEMGNVTLNLVFTTTNTDVAPLITSHPGNISVNEGQSAQFSVAASGSPAPSYQWQRQSAGSGAWENLSNTGNYTGVNTTTLTVSAATAAMNGDRFRCLASNGAGSTLSLEATLSVTPLTAPTFISQPANASVNPGENAQFSVGVAGSPPLYYQWEYSYDGGRNWNTMYNQSDFSSGAQSQTLSLTRVSRTYDASLFRCSVSNSVAIGVKSSAARLSVAITPPRVDMGGSQLEVDLGGALTLAPFIAGSEPLTFAWRRWDASEVIGNSPALAITNATVDTESYYKITVSNPFGEVTQGIWVLVRTPPRINWQPVDIDVSDGGTAYFDVVVASYTSPTFQWQRLRAGSATWENVSGLGYSGHTTQRLSVYSLPVAATGDQFRCVITNPRGTTISRAASLQVHPRAPGISLNYHDYNQFGSTAVIDAIVEGTQPITLQWQFNGSDILGANSSSLSVPNFQAANVGTYTLVATNAQGAASYSAMLRLEPAPAIIRPPFSQAVAPGGNITLKVDAVGYVSPLIYEWRRNGVAIPGAASSILTLTNIQAAQLGEYSVVVSNPTGSVVSSAARLAFSGPTFVSRPLTQILREGQSLMIDATAQGAGTVTYSWRRNRAVLPNQTSATLSIPTASLKDGGYYEVFASDNIGTTRSVFYMHVAPAVGEVLATGGVGGYGEGVVPADLGDVVGIAAGENSSLAIKPDGRVVEWGGLLTRTGTQVPTGLTGVVQVACNTDLGYALKRDGTVVGWSNLYSPNIPSGLRDVVAISVGSAVVALKADGSVVQWGWSSSPQVPVGLSDVVAVACARFHVVALRSDGSIVVWGDGSEAPGQFPNGGPQSNVIGVATGRYHGLALIEGGTVTGWGQAKDMVFPIHDAIAVSAGFINAQNYAIGADGSLVGVGAAAPVPASIGGAYAVSSGASHTLILHDPTLTIPVIRKQPISIQAITGASVSFTVSVLGQPPLAFQWQSAPANDETWTDATNNATIAGANTSTLSVSDLILQQDGLRFRVVVTNNLGQATSIPASLTVKVAPPTVDLPLQAMVVRAGSAAVLTITASGPAPLAYQWFLNGTEIPGATAASHTIDDFQSANAGLYSVRVSNAGGSATSNANVSIATLASISTQPQSATVYSTQNHTLSISATSNAPIAYQWKKAGVPIIGATQPSLVFSPVQLGDAGDYSVDLTTLAGTVRSSSATLTVLAGATPAITRQPQNRAAVELAPASFVVAATGDPAPTYQWQRLPASTSTWINLSGGGDNDYLGVNTPTLTVLGGTQLTNNGDRFRCVVSNIVGTVTSAEVTLTVWNPGFAKISAGRYHSLRLDVSGRLFAAGANTYNQLGAGDSATSTPWPVALAFTGAELADIAAGAQHSMILTANHQLIVMGYNGNGQLGDGSSLTSGGPALLAENVVGIGAAVFHSAYLKSDGTLWTFGGNDEGQLGNGNMTDSRVPAQIATGVVDFALGTRQTLFIKADGTLWGVGDLYNNPTLTSTPVKVADGVKAVAAGGYHSLFLKTDGSLWGLGFNSSGQLGTGTTATATVPVQITTGVKAVAAGFFHSVFLKDDNTLWTMGINGSGQQGDGSTASRLSPRQLAANVAAISANEVYTLFTKLDGSLWAVGGNANGQWGRGDSVSSSTPVQITAATVITPAQPVGMSAGSIASANRVRLLWQPKADAQTYEIWRNTTDDSSTATRLAADVRRAIFEDGTAVAGQTYRYWVRAVNSAGSSPFSLSVAASATTPAAPMIVAQPQNQTLTIGAEVTFEVSVAGTAPFYYQWRKNSQLIDGANGPSYTISSASDGDAGNYDVVVTNAFGSVTSDVATLRVRINQTITFGPIPDLAYSNRNKQIAGTSSSGLPVTLTVESGPISISNNQIVFLGIGPVTVRATQSGNSEYAPAPDVVSTFNITPPENDNFSAALFLTGGSVTAFGTNKFCSAETGEPAHITAQPGGASIWWKWRAPYGADVVVNTNGSDFDTQLAVYAGTALSSLTAIASNDDATAGSVNTSSVRFLAAAGTDYYFAVDGKAGATGSVQLNLAAVPSNGGAPLLNSQPADTTVVVGQSAVFSFSYSGAPPVILIWERMPAGSSQWSYFSSALPLGFQVTAAMDGDQFRCTATNSFGSVTTNIVRLSVNKLSQSISFGSLSDRLFTPTSIQLAATASSGLPIAFSVVSGPARVNGSQLTLTGAGAVTIRASQAGDSTYAAAPDVDRTFVVSETVASWQSTRFTEAELLDPAISGPNADPDHDGIPNLVEYALGHDPRANSASSLPPVSVTETDWSFTYTRPADRTDVIYVVECSTDLVTWTPLTSTHVRVSSANGSETWTATQPRSGAPNCYFRLAVTRQSLGN